jgi:hypothetical protein
MGFLPQVPYPRGCNRQRDQIDQVERQWMHRDDQQRTVFQEEDQSWPLEFC